MRLLVSMDAKASTEVYDLAVIGGGLVGAAIAYGLRGSGQRIVDLDEGDVAFRASRGNFALVWVHCKGMGMAAYGRWTLESARLWPAFAARLLILVVFSLRYAANVGMAITLGWRNEPLSLALLYGGLSRLFLGRALALLKLTRASAATTESFSKRDRAGLC